MSSYTLQRTSGIYKANYDNQPGYVFSAWRTVDNVLSSKKEIIFFIHDDIKNICAVCNAGSSYANKHLIYTRYDSGNPYPVSKNCRRIIIKKLKAGISNHILI